MFSFIDPKYKNLYYELIEITGGRLNLYDGTRRIALFTAIFDWSIHIKSFLKTVAQNKNPALLMCTRKCLYVQVCNTYFPRFQKTCNKRGAMDINNNNNKLLEKKGNAGILGAPLAFADDK